MGRSFPIPAAFFETFEGGNGGEGRIPRRLTEPQGSPLGLKEAESCRESAHFRRLPSRNFAFPYPTPTGMGGYTESPRKHTEAETHIRPPLESAHLRRIPIRNFAPPYPPPHRKPAAARIRIKRPRIRIFQENTSLGIRGSASAFSVVEGRTGSPRKPKGAKTNISRPRMRLLRGIPHLGFLSPYPPLPT